MFKITPVWKICAVALLLLLGGVLCSRLSHPWTYNDDYNGAFWSQAARNLSRAGFLSSYGVPAPLYFGAPPIPAEMLYVHHPALLAAMMLADHALLCESEAAARCLPIFFSLLTALLLWLFVSGAMGWRAGAFALAFFVAAGLELHYGQMVNFEAPELFFMLAALWCFQRRQIWGLVACCAGAMWTDWQGYVLTAILFTQLLLQDPRGNWKRCAALAATACVSGVFFLLQIRLASPAAWTELFHAFRERTSHADLSGGSFTAMQWVSTEFTYLTTLYHPVVWVLAIAGAVLAWVQRKRLSAPERGPIHAAIILFAIDAFYVLALRNQSYIHDFASFYFLVPLSVFPAFLVERIVRDRPIAYTFAACALAGAMIWLGIRQLDGIDTQFCILGDDDTEPPTLMPDVGKVIDQTFAQNDVVICNFDQYYSPLPFYARHEMTNAVRSYADWQQAVSDALPHQSGGIIWTDEPGAPELLGHFPAKEKRDITVDGIRFVLWLPRVKELDAPSLAPSRKD